MLLGVEERIPRCCTGEDDIDTVAGGNHAIVEMQQDGNNLAGLDNMLKSWRARGDVVNQGIVRWTLANGCKVFDKVPREANHKLNIEGFHFCN